MPANSTNPNLRNGSAPNQLRASNTNSNDNTDINNRIAGTVEPIRNDSEIREIGTDASRRQRMHQRIAQFSEMLSPTERLNVLRYFEEAMRNEQLLRRTSPAQQNMRNELQQRFESAENQASTSQDLIVEAERAMRVFRYLDPEARTISESGSALNAAAEAGDLEAIIDLLALGADINGRDARGFTPFLTAVKSGRVDVLDLLRKNGADIDSWVERSSSANAIHIAAVRGDVEVINYLGKIGASVGTQNSDGRTPLHTAVPHPKEVIKALINVGVNPCATDNKGYQPLHSAASVPGCESAISGLLENRSVDVNAKTADGFTALHLAIAKSNAASVGKLIEHGAAVNEPSDGGELPLILAASRGDMEMVSLLLSAGADPALIDPKVGTAAHGAANHGNDTIIECLHRSGADLNQQLEDVGSIAHLVADNSIGENTYREAEEQMTSLITSDQISHNTPAFGDGRTAPEELYRIRTAIDGYVVERMRLLEQLGVNLDESNSLGYRPIHIAAGRGNALAVEMLAETGASVSSKAGESNLTPLHMAIKAGSFAAAKCLIDRNCSITDRLPDGKTAAHLVVEHMIPNRILDVLALAERYGVEPGDAGIDEVEKSFSDSQELLELLAAEGLNLSSPDNDGKTPIDIARERNVPRLVAMLESPTLS